MNSTTSSFWSESLQNELDKLLLCNNIMLNSSYYSDLPYDHFTKKISTFFENIKQRSFRKRSIGSFHSQLIPPY